MVARTGGGPLGAAFLCPALAASGKSSSPTIANLLEPKAESRFAINRYSLPPKPRLSVSPNLHS
jgi:hypothetical protein